jgi:hypothetical protein
MTTILNAVENNCKDLDTLQRQLVIQVQKKNGSMILLFILSISINIVKISHYMI